MLFPCLITPAPARTSLIGSGQFFCDQRIGQVFSIHIHFGKDAEIFPALQLPQFNIFCIAKQAYCFFSRSLCSFFFCWTAAPDLWRIHAPDSDWDMAANDGRPVFDIGSEGIGVINTGDFIDHDAAITAGKSRQGQQGETIKNNFGGH